MSTTRGGFIRERGNVALAVLLGAVVLSVAWMVAATMAPNHDNYWLLIAAGRMLHGGSYLTDFFEVNPPLVLFLYAPAKAVSEFSGLDPYLVFRVLILTYAVVSLAILKLTVNAFYARGSAAHTWLMPIAGIVVLLIPGYSFGQREHLISIFLLPYLAFHGAFAWGDRPPPRAASVLAAWASLGIFLKPPFVLLPVLLAVWRAIGRRSFRAIFDAETITFALLGVAYVGAVVIFYPGYFYVAELAAEIYGAYNIPLNLVLKMILPYLAMGLVPFVAAPLLNGNSQDRRVILVLFMALTVSAIAIFAQHKAFGYHIVPVKVFGLVAALLTIPMAIRHAAREPRRWLAVAPTILSVSAVAVFLAGQTARDYLRHTDDRLERETLFSSLCGVAAGKPVFVFSSAVTAGLPEVPMVHGTYASRFSSLWLVPGYFYAVENSGLPAERIERLGALARQYVEKDFRRYRPAVVVVDRSEDMPGFKEPFDMLEFFTASPTFAAVWKDYTILEHLDQFDIYTRRGSADRPDGPSKTGHACP